jgi:hypothetical protein
MPFTKATQLSPARYQHVVYGSPMPAALTPEQELELKYYSLARARVEAEIKEKEVIALARIGGLVHKYKHAPVIYALWDGARVKIGTTTDFKQRFASTQKDFVHEVTVLAIRYGDEELENGYKKWLDMYNIIGEWFRPGTWVLDAIEEIGKNGYRTSEPLPVKAPPK